MNLINVAGEYIKTQLASTLNNREDEISVTGSNKHMDKVIAYNLTKYQWWKNVFDRLMAAFIMVVLSPLMVVVALIIKLDSPGSAIFRREQIGKNGRKFTLYKFRTMQANNDDSEYKSYITKYVLEDAPYTVDQNGQAVYKVTNDPRVTRVGDWLRKTNLDELPQFINVLKGDMSAIGPRPDIPFAVNLYSDWHRQRFQVKPGITGLWQVSKRKGLSFDNMVQLDIEYINKQSFLLDTKIFLQTLSIILKRDGS